MDANTQSERSFEFYLADLDTLLLVENEKDYVLIRASRDTLTEQRKLQFLHHIAAEGFIPDECQFISALASPRARVQWVVDSSWVQLYPAASRRARHFMFRLLLGAGLVWMAMMAAVCGIHP